jgi:cytochrome c oxidase cbb3-type subunit 4
MADFYAWLKSLWVVWLIVLFVGIVVWAYWPSRKSKMDDHAKIPFREDDEKRN